MGDSSKLAHPGPARDGSGVTDGERDWEHFYQTGDTFWDKGEPAPGLTDFLAAHPNLSRGGVAVPGCGFGHDARAWAEAGFDTQGFDLAPSAVKGATERHGSLPRLRFAQADFLATIPDRPFAWLFEHTLYCAITPSRRADYARAAARWVEPGGSFLAIHYLRPEAPEGPPFPCTSAEILDRFGDTFELVADWEPRSFPNRTGREWMYWWRRR